MDTERVVVGTITVKQDVTEKLISDTLGAAFDWGPGWILEVRIVGPEPEGAAYVEDVVAKGGKAQITEGDDFGETSRYILNRDMVLSGFRQWAALPYGRTPAQIEDDPADAVEATNILQLALFGEIIYG